MKNLTPEEKSKRIRTALAMVHVTTSELSAEIVWRVIERMDEIGDQFSLRDAAVIIDDVRNKLEAEDDFILELRKVKNELKLLRHDINRISPPPSEGRGANS